MNPLQMLGALQKTQNPMALLSQFAGQNPQLKKVMEVINGKSPQELEDEDYPFEEPSQRAYCWLRKHLENK